MRPLEGIPALCEVSVPVDSEDDQQLTFAIGHPDRFVGHGPERYRVLSRVVAGSEAVFGLGLERVFRLG